MRVYYLLFINKDADAMGVFIFEPVFKNKPGQPEKWRYSAINISWT